MNMRFAAAQSSEQRVYKLLGVEGLQVIDALAHAGVDQMIIGIGGNDDAGYDLSEVRELIAWRDSYNAR